MKNGTKKKAKIEAKPIEMKSNQQKENGNLKEGQVREEKRHPAPESQFQPTNDEGKPVVGEGSDQKHR